MDTTTTTTSSWTMVMVLYYIRKRIYKPKDTRTKKWHIKVHTSLKYEATFHPLRPSLHATLYTLPCFVTCVQAHIMGHLLAHHVTAMSLVCFQLDTFVACYHHLSPFISRLYC